MPCVEGGGQVWSGRRTHTVRVQLARSGLLGVKRRRVGRSCEEREHGGRVGSGWIGGDERIGNRNS